jgi:hypothetical protein
MWGTGARRSGAHDDDERGAARPATASDEPADDERAIHVDLVLPRHHHHDPARLHDHDDGGERALGAERADGLVPGVPRRQPVEP